VNLVQRVLLIAVTLTFAIVTALLIQWARRPDLGILYSGLDAEDASKIVDKINEKNISYELRNGGTTILCPKKDIARLRLEMAREGLPSGDQTGYSIFDKEKVGVSPFVQNVNLRRALQEELAKSIQMIDGVLHARVHIVSAERNVFTAQAAETSASVVLRLRPGYSLSELNIAAITNLVAGSVAGLKSEKVTVVDSQGRLLSSESEHSLAHGAGTVQAYKERVEQTLEKKVEDMLTTVLGPGRATVRIWATIDMNSVNTVVETYEPKGVVTKEQIQSSTKPVAAAGSGTGQSGTTPQPEKTEDITTEYEVGKTVRTLTVLPGQVVSLKVSAFVDLSAAAQDANAPGGKVLQVADVEEIIKNALGLEDASAIKVVDVKFNQPFEALAAEEPSNWPRYLAIVRHASMGIMAICAFFVLRIFRGAKQKAGATGAGSGLPEAQGIAAGKGPAGLLTEEAEGSAQEPFLLRRQITGALQKNPEQVKRLFASWVEQS